MKKLIALVLITVGLFVFSACDLSSLINNNNLTGDNATIKDGTVDQIPENGEIDKPVDSSVVEDEKDDQNEEGGEFEIGENQISDEESYDEEEPIIYTEYGPYYQIISNDIIHLYRNMIVSSMYFYVIEFEYKFENMVYTVSSENITFTSENTHESGRTMQVRYGDKCRCGIDYPLSDENAGIYITIIARIDDEIVGYGLLRKTNEASFNSWEVVEFVFNNDFEEDKS